MLGCGSVPKRENELPVLSGSREGPCRFRAAAPRPVQGTPRESQRVSCFFFPFLSLSQPVGALSAHDVEPRIHAASAEGAIPLGSLTAEVFTLLRLS